MTWSWHVLWVLGVAWLFQNAFHELSHLVTAYKVEGRLPIRLVPHFHKHDGRWYFARYQSVERPTKSGCPIWRHSSPFHWGSVEFMVLGVIFVSVLHSGWNAIFVIPFLFVALVDVLFFWWTFFWGGPLSDGQQLRLAWAKRREPIKVETHISEAKWEGTARTECESHLYPCDEWEARRCICMGACDCHWETS